MRARTDGQPVNHHNFGIKMSPSPSYPNNNVSEPDIEVPKHLYRAWSDQSNGRNERTCLAPEISRLDPPARTAEFHGLRVDASSHAMEAKDQLIRALQRKPGLHRNPFVFFTSSLPQDIIHAFYKDRRESNVRITCVDTTTARTPSGERVRFFRVREIMLILGITLTEGHTFEELDFEDVWVTCDIVIIGLGSSIAWFDDLDDNDLCRCIPELREIRRYSPGVAGPIRNLREYWFGQDRDLDRVEFALAARVASVFEPVWPNESRDFVQMHVFAWVLTMKEQIADRPGLANWLGDNGTLPAPSYGIREVETIQATKLCEVQRFNEIYSVLRPRKLRMQDISMLNTSVSDSSVNARRKDFATKRAKIRQVREEKRQKWLAGNKVKTKAKLDAEGTKVRSGAKAMKTKRGNKGSKPSSKSRSRPPMQELEESDSGDSESERS